MTTPYMHLTANTPPPPYAILWRTGSAADGTIGQAILASMARFAQALQNPLLNLSDLSATPAPAISELIVSI